MYRQIDEKYIVKYLNVNRENIAETKEIADYLNLHFSTVGQELPKIFSIDSNDNFLKFLTKVNKEIIAIDLVHETHITKLIERFSNKKQ